MLFAIKGFFFIYSMAMAAYKPYLALFFETNGLTGTQIGILLALGPILRFITAPYWGIIADRKEWHRQIIIVCCVVCGFVTLLYIRSTLFWQFALVQILFFFFLTPLLPFSDKIALEMQEHKLLDFGKSRYWGSLGFAIMAVLSGYIATFFGLNILFIIVAVSMFVLVFLSKNLYISKSSIKRQINFKLVELFHKKEMIAFYISGLLLCSSVFATSSYFALLIKHLGANESLTGLSWSMLAFVEIPVFFYSTRILIKTSVEKLLMLSFIFNLMQIVSYNFAYIPLTATIVHTIKGITFPLFYIAAVNFVQKEAPAGLKTTGQTMMSAILLGLAALIGNLAGGVIYDKFGIYFVYKVAVILILIGTICNIVYVYQPFLKKEEYLEKENVKL